MLLRAIFIVLVGILPSNSGLAGGDVTLIPFSTYQSDPPNSFFLSYFSNRNFNVDIESPAAGDLGVESIVFVKAEDNPTGLPLILTGNEISGTTSAFIVSIQPAPQDCNGNGVSDLEDISSGTSSDCNRDSIPDECQLTGDDCDNNGELDTCELSEVADCNNNGILDSCDIASGTSSDIHGDLIPDSCQGSPFVRGDSNRDGQMDVSDAVQILAFLFQGGANNCQPALDFNGDEILDLSDVLGSLNFVFTGTAPPASPYPDCDWPAGLLGSCEASLLCP